MRNDDHGYKNQPRWLYSDPRNGPLTTADPGSPIQQHWVTHERASTFTYEESGWQRSYLSSSGSFVYCPGRPESPQIIRSTEQILVPEFGARLGNFCVTEVRAENLDHGRTEHKRPEWNDASVRLLTGDNRVWVVKLK